MVKKNCLYCKKEYNTKPCWVNKSKYCSKECFGLIQRGVKLSKEHRDKIVKSLIGRKHSEETKQKIRNSMKGKNKIGHPCSEETKKKLRLRESNKGINNPFWKGDQVGLEGLHKWVRRWKSKPALCERCKLVPPLDAANISGKYKRDINDFEWICRKCHIHSDGRLEKMRRGHKKWRERKQSVQIYYP